ncbi:hypothetical protein BMS3Bbin04_01003 [bacterium BMS3Bbin04]|nr:hypothetical protein BMS3Bbin04_01003 [bacterium BMS3Bbin04]
MFTYHGLQSVETGPCLLANADHPDLTSTSGQTSCLFTCPQLSPAIGGLLSVALSIASRRPAVSRHPVLRSSDFPPLLNLKRGFSVHIDQLRRPSNLLGHSRIRRKVSNEDCFCGEMPDITLHAPNSNSERGINKKGQPVFSGCPCYS